MNRGYQPRSSAHGAPPVGGGTGRRPPLELFVLGNSLVVIHGDDWSGLFVNKTLVTEGHSIRIEDLAKHLPITAIEQKFMSRKGLRRLEHDAQFAVRDLDSALARYVEA